MPTYQYACTECGEQLEAVQKFSDDALTVCPTCNGKLRKVFSAVGIVFKGSGFYRTDSRSGSSSSSTVPAANGSNGSGSEGSGDTKSGEKNGEKKSESTSSSGASGASGSAKSGSAKGGSSSGSGEKVA